VFPYVDRIGTYRYAPRRSAKTWVQVTRRAEVFGVWLCRFARFHPLSPRGTRVNGRALATILRDSARRSRTSAQVSRRAPPHHPTIASPQSACADPLCSGKISFRAGAGARSQVATGHSTGRVDRRCARRSTHSTLNPIHRLRRNAPPDRTNAGPASMGSRSRVARSGSSACPKCAESGPNRISRRAVFVSTEGL
jgi:hypothetical protein